MIQIRHNVFETNSSSTHSLVIVPDNLKEFWIGYDGIILNKFERNLIYAENIEKHNNYHSENKIIYDENNFEEAINKYVDIYGLNGYDDPLTLQEWLDDEYLESGSETYITPKGEKINIYYKYGFDG